MGFWVSPLKPTIAVRTIRLSLRRTQGLTSFLTSFRAVRSRWASDTAAGDVEAATDGGVSRTVNVIVTVAASTVHMRIVDTQAPCHGRPRVPAWVWRRGGVSTHRQPPRPQNLGACDGASCACGSVGE